MNPDKFVFMSSIYSRCVQRRRPPYYPQWLHSTNAGARAQSDSLSLGRCGFWDADGVQENRTSKLRNYVRGGLTKPGHNPLSPWLQPDPRDLRWPFFAGGPCKTIATRGDNQHTNRDRFSSWRLFGSFATIAVSRDALISNAQPAAHSDPIEPLAHKDDHSY